VFNAGEAAVPTLHFSAGIRIVTRPGRGEFGADVLLPGDSAERDAGLKAARGSGIDADGPGESADGGTGTRGFRTLDFGTFCSYSSKAFRWSWRKVELSPFSFHSIMNLLRKV
jgi:hypothetical protein